MTVAVSVHRLALLERGDFGHVDDIQDFDGRRAEGKRAVAVDGEIAQRVGRDRAGDAQREQSSQHREDTTG